MKILVTGAKGFVGKNLCAQLNNIKDGKARNYGIQVDAVFEYDLDNTRQELDNYCQQADFVFNLAGVNRPQNQEEFMQGNYGFTSTLLGTLKKCHNTSPVMLSSSQQASLSGRFGKSEYGRSKKAGEDLMFEYSQQTGAKVLVYRFPNLFGKWCQPNYNSAVATFCNAFANDLPYTVNDPSVELELLYIDDLVDEMISALTGGEHHCEFNGLDVIPQADGRYCYVPITHKASLGQIVELLNQFEAQRTTLVIPEIPDGSFAKKLYNEDYRGSFVEILRTKSCGQFSVNVCKPGITRGQHWHNSKWEIFAVVYGRGLIQERNIWTDEVISFEVSGDEFKAIQMLPGYTHNIINLSDKEPLITFMWANEMFDSNRPDTYFEPVEK